jgi:murein DD-endopeptidase MepM/ murein hydrolase activator NlpD
MYGQKLILLHKWRFAIIVPLLLVADLFLMSLIPSSIGPTPAQRSQAVAAQLESEIYGTPTVVTSIMTKATDGAKRTAVAAGNTSRSILSYTGMAAANTSKFIVRSLLATLTFVGRIIHTCTTFVVHAAVGSAVFIVHIPGNVLGFVSDTASASPITRPSANAHLPVIDPNKPVVVPAVAKAPAITPAVQTLPNSNSDAAWPIHGAITTLYGVPHWPYQPIHTGLDISSGPRSGVTPVMPFKPGRVADTVRAGYGLGNHVVIDHGGGVTSVYGHLASITVQIGQNVDKNTILGYEGSTGASTGTHLHLEIRLNGQVVDPRHHISGQP